MKSGGTLREAALKAIGETEWTPPQAENRIRSMVEGRPDWLDLALVYALMNFIGVIAVLKFVRFGNLASDQGGNA